MEQLSLFNESHSSQLSIHITRSGDELMIPEGIHTVPCTHGMHRFPGKFIPNIVRYFFRSEMLADKNRVIMDPFCGSGTTLVEAALDGRKFLGADIDPLSVMITRAKTQPLTNEELSELEGVWASHDYDEFIPNLVPEVPNLEHWFSETAIRELTSIKGTCLELPPRLQLFSLVVFSSIIRRVSNADNQTQKTYVSHTLPKDPPKPSEIFPVFIERAIIGMREYSQMLPKTPQGLIVRADARGDITLNSFNDIITSPPYIDSIDYIYNQMLEYYWLLCELEVESFEKLRELRKEPMGFTLYENEKTSDFARNCMPVQGRLFEDICETIAKKSKKESNAVRGFFFDFAEHLQHIRKRQANGDLYICIVGNSFIRGTTVPTANFVAELFQMFGYAILDKVRYAIRRHYMKFPRRSNSGKIKEDNIIICQAE